MSYTLTGVTIATCHKVPTVFKQVEFEDGTCAYLPVVCVDGGTSGGGEPIDLTEIIECLKELKKVHVTATEKYCVRYMVDGVYVTRDLILEYLSDGTTQTMVRNIIAGTVDPFALPDGVDAESVDVRCGSCNEQIWKPCTKTAQLTKNGEPLTKNGEPLEITKCTKTVQLTKDGESLTKDGEPLEITK